jgi:hypothetical protein
LVINIILIIIYYFCIVIGHPKEKDVLLLHSIQAGCGNHPASYTMGTGGDFSGDNAARE